MVSALARRCSVRKVNPICGFAVTTRIRMMGNRGKNVSFDGVQPWRRIIRRVENSKVPGRRLTFIK